jgi:hypothetical protein
MWIEDEPSDRPTLIAAVMLLVVLALVALLLP